MHCQFGLIVTGKGEEEFLPKFFRSLADRKKGANCSFVVLGRIGQLSPRTSQKPKNQQRISGEKQAITSKAQDMGLMAKGYLMDKRTQQNRFVLLIDDVERDRRPQLASIFNLYRTALDTILSPQDHSRAGVHFFANMLEAYYFANSQAVNTALGAAVIPEDHRGDVEEIPHPKNALEKLHPAFRERKDGGKIVAELDLDHILRDPETCAFLRSLFGWCVEKLLASSDFCAPALASRYQLALGKRAEITKNQVRPA